MAKKKTKKAARCVRKTKEGKRCKAKAPAGRKTCVFHGGSTKKKAKKRKVTKKKTKRKTAKKKAPRKKVTRKKAKKKAAKKKTKRKTSKKKAFGAMRCEKILVSGKRCSCYCEPGGVYCASHRKRSKRAIRNNPYRGTINTPF